MNLNLIGQDIQKQKIHLKPEAINVSDVSLNNNDMKVNGSSFCEICNKNVTKFNWASHIKTKIHWKSETIYDRDLSLNDVDMKVNVYVKFVIKFN